MLDPGRTGPVWSAINQSLRGAIARLAGEDLTSVWLVFAAAAAVLGVWAALGVPAGGGPHRRRCSRCSSPAC